MTGPTEREKMLRGEPYDAYDADLVAARARARRLWRRFNAIDNEARDEQAAVLRELLGAYGEGALIEQPFLCDYGAHITVGAGAYLNMQCLVLDSAAVTIGPQAFLGPNVQLITADHPRLAAERLAGTEFAKPVTVGARSWLGAGVIVCPGVTIGEESVVGAGSVVTRDVPPRVVAAGNPCRVIRSLE